MSDSNRSNLPRRSGSGAAGVAPVRLASEPGMPLYQQIYESLRADILHGHLAPGKRLAPTRVLARDLGVSRNTVVVAFELLAAEGYLTGCMGSGTFVSRELPERLLAVAPRTTKRKRARSQRTRPPRISSRAAHVCTTVNTTRPPTLPFRSGTPALEEFPFGIWNRLATKAAKQLTARQHDYGDLAGYRPLRVAITEALRTSRGVVCSPDEIVVVGGSQSGLDLVARVLLESGDRVWVENPGYGGMRAALAGAGAEPVPVPIDADGIRVDVGRERCPHARLACVTPSHQYPTGVTLSLARRLELLEWAQHEDAWILEDDYDSEYRYVGRPLSPLKRLDEHGRVLYVGTFSKVLFPALRLGYLVLPDELVDPFLRMRFATSREAPIGVQAVLARFLEQGHFARHVRRMRVLYGERQQILRDAAERECGELLRIPASETGIHAIGWLPRGADDRALARAAEDAGVVAMPISALATAERDDDAPTIAPGFVLGYAGFDEPTLRGAMYRLGRVLAASFGG